MTPPKTTKLLEQAEQLWQGITLLDQRMSGIRYTPKHLRDERFMEFAKEREKLVEKYNKLKEKYDKQQ